MVQQIANWLSNDFHVYGPGTSWNNVGGIYIFTRLNAQGLWLPLYVGKTESFADRLPNHERWQEAMRRGATHIHAKAVRQAASRDQLERDLIQAYQPPLNDQLK